MALSNPSGGATGLLNNWTAIGSPTVTNDASQGYSVGSYWQNASSGVRWTCRDATTGAAVWVRNDNADFFGYVANRYYLDFGVAQTGTAATMPVGTMRLYPVLIKERHVVNAFGLRITTVSAGGNAAVAQYRADPASRFPVGTPSVVSGNISTATTGAAMVATTATPVLEAGMYWIATMCDNATAVAIGVTNSAYPAMQLIGSTTEANAAGANINLNYSLTGQTYGTWPDLTNTTLTETPTNTVQTWFAHRFVSTAYG